MPKPVEVLVAPASTFIFGGAGTNYIVQTPAGVLYLVYTDFNLDLSWKKSMDGGLTWSVPTLIFAGSLVSVSVWYDRWSNISAGLIHIAWTESGTDDTLYRTLNTESSDALSTQTTIFAGGTTAAGGALSITRAVGGNVYCATMIDAGAEGGFFRLPNANVPNGAWDAARTTVFEGATQDQIILAPDYDAADNQDILAFFWDASADEISRKLYDDSANSWAETSIATSMVDGIAGTAWPHFSIAPDLANTRHILVAWSAIDTLNADLRCWTVDASTITEVTNVVQNSTDDQGLCGVCLDTISGLWWVFYVGKTDGSETFSSDVNIYYKISTNGGSTWGAETKLTISRASMAHILVIPRLLFLTSAPPPMIGYFSSGFTLHIMAGLPSARAQLGI